MVLRSFLSVRVGEKLRKSEKAPARCCKEKAMSELE